MLKKYLRQVEAERRKDTYRTYAVLLSSFDNWLRKQNKSIENCEREDIVAYLKKKDNWTKKTGETFLTIVKTFLRWYLRKIPNPTTIPELRNYNMIRNRIEDILDLRYPTSIEKIPREKKKEALTIDVVITDSASGSGCDIGNGYVYHTCTKMVVSNLAPGSKATKTCTYSLDPGTYYAIGFVYQRDGPCLDGRYISFVVEEPPPPPPILFKSGFETGNLSEWDDVIRDASCVHYYVSSVIRHSGSHGFCADFYTCYPNIRHVHLFKYALTPAVPGRKIRPSIWVHDNIWGGYLIQLTFYKGITRISSHVEYKDVPPWNKLKWIKLTYSSVTIPSGCDNIALMLKVGAWDGDTAVDDVLLEYL